MNSQSNRAFNADSEKEQIGSSMIHEYMGGDTSMREEGESKERMPICEGLLNNRKVQVLRDMGCSSAAVKMSLVNKHQLTGNDVTCTLIDGTQEIPISSYTGKHAIFHWRSRSHVHRKPII